MLAITLKENEMKTLSINAIVLWLTLAQIGIGCTKKELVQIEDATNTVVPKSGTRHDVDQNVEETFNPVFTVNVKFKIGSQITFENVTSGYTCSSWSWAITGGTNPQKVMFVESSTSCDAVYSHLKGGGQSSVSIGANVTYTFDGKSDDDPSSGNGSFEQ